MQRKKKISLSPLESSLTNHIHELLLRYKNYIRHAEYHAAVNLMHGSISEKNSAKLRAALLTLGQDEIVIPSAIDMTEEAGLCPKYAKSIAKQIVDLEKTTGSLPWETLAEIAESMMATA